MPASARFFHFGPHFPENVEHGPQAAPAENLEFVVVNSVRRMNVTHFSSPPENAGQTQTHRQEQSAVQYHSHIRHFRLSSWRTKSLPQMSKRPCRSGKSNAHMSWAHRVIADDIGVAVRADVCEILGSAMAELAKAVALRSASAASLPPRRVRRSKAACHRALESARNRS